MVNTVWVNADHGHDLHPLADHFFYFSAFCFSLQLMHEQALTNLIVCLMISQKLHTKVAQMSQHVAVDTR